jgi:hypothetical protein
MQLSVDTSWWTRYRSRTQNPDIDTPSFQQAVLNLSQGQFPAIPRDDSDITIDKTGKHIQAIANTAAFHFAFIEVGGSSLYPTLALSVTHPEVLRILLSIGPTETSHFQTWHDKAGNAVSDPLAPLTDHQYQARVSEPQCSQATTLGGLPDQFDHARALPVPQPKVPGSFDYSPDLDKKLQRGGDCQSLQR